MRIAVIAPPWFAVPPPGYGGIELIAAMLADGLTERGHDVTLVAPGGSRTGARLVSPLPEPVPMDAPNARTEDLIHTTRAFLDAHDMDVISTHSDLGPAFGSLLGGSPPVVHTLHGPWDPDTARYLDLVHDRVHLVSISRAQQATNPNVRYAAVIPNGIDLDRYPLREDKEDFLLFVGRANAEKGPEHAVDVARRAGRPLVMVVKRAEQAEKEYWDGVVGPRLTGREVILESVGHEEKVDLMGRAAALLAPIQWEEPFGLVLAEAMACGTPVLACPHGAAPEVVAHGRTGILCPVDDMPDALDAATGLSPTECRSWVAERFSSTAMLDGYEALFQRLVEERPARAGARDA